MDADEHRAYIQKQLLEECNAVLPQVAADLGLETDEARRVLVEVSIRMFNAGIRVGATQALAQLAEQGADFQVHMDPSLLPSSDSDTSLS